jgi:HlyD family secretion protein
MSEPDLSALRREPSVPPPASRWKSRVLLPAGILCLFAAVFAFAARDSLFPGSPVRVVPVVTKASGGADAGGSVTSQAAGWVEADPFPMYVAALADGVVKEVLVLEGEAVQAGQVVARLVDDDARIALARAEAELRDAIAMRETADRDLETLVERRRADAVAAAAHSEAKAELESSAADIAASEAKVKSREAVVRSDESLVKAGALQELTLVQERLELDALRAETEALRAARRVAEARLVQAGAERDAAAEGLRLLLAERLAAARAKAAEDGARAARDEAALRLARMEVRATAAGVVQKRLAAPGSKVMAVMDDPHSSHIVHLYDPARLQVRVDIPLAEASRVGVGHGARVVVEILPDRVFKGEVTRIVNEADIQKNTLQVKVRILDPVPELKPEMLARAQFLSPAKAAGSSPRGTERVFAPSRLLRPSGTGKATALVAERGVAVAREVVLGHGREEDWVEVTSGLAPGDRLVDAAPGEVLPGRRIRVIGEGR